MEAQNNISESGVAHPTLACLTSTTTITSPTTSSSSESSIPLSSSGSIKTPPVKALNESLKRVTENCVPIEMFQTILEKIVVSETVLGQLELLSIAVKRQLPSWEAHVKVIREMQDTLVKMRRESCEKFLQ